MINGQQARIQETKALSMCQSKSLCDKSGTRSVFSLWSESLLSFEVNNQSLSAGSIVLATLNCYMLLNSKWSEQEMKAQNDNSNPFSFECLFSTFWVSLLKLFAARSHRKTNALLMAFTHVLLTPPQMYFAILLFKTWLRWKESGRLYQGWSKIGV